MPEGSPVNVLVSDTQFQLVGMNCEELLEKARSLYQAEEGAKPIKLVYDDLGMCLRSLQFLSERQVEAAATTMDIAQQTDMRFPDFDFVAKTNPANYLDVLFGFAAIATFREAYQIAVGAFCP